MVLGIARCLKPGGRFVTMNANPGLEFERGATYLKYGFEIRGSGEQQEGLPYTWVFHLDEGPVEVENYWLPATAYEEALRRRIRGGTMAPTPNLTHCRSGA